MIPAKIIDTAERAVKVNVVPPEGNDVRRPAEKVAEQGAEEGTEQPLIGEIEEEDDEDKEKASVPAVREIPRGGLSMDLKSSILLFYPFFFD